MTTIKVQDCGCIALPDEIVAQTALYPGATLSISVMPDGKTILLVPVEAGNHPEPPLAYTSCKL